MLLGRAAERERIAGLLGDARAGRSGAILLVGDPGVGKTALLEDAVTAFTGLRVLRTSGYEMETDLPFAALGALLRPLQGGIANLPAPQAAALAGALGLGPALPPGDRFTAYAGALTLLADAAEAGPALVAVDDAHWLDPASLDALAFIARRIQAEGIVILMAAREEPPAALDQADGIAILQVRGLAAPQAREFLTREHGHGLAPEVADALAAATGGNPLALLEAGRALSPDQAAGRAPLPDPVPVGPDITRALGARLADVPADTRRALLIAAAGAGGRPALVADALHAAGVSAALAPAEDAGLVHNGPQGVVFDHPLVRSAVYQAASPSQRREAHRALAEAARTHGEPADDELARHLAGAANGPDPHAADAMEAAGRRAAARMAYAEAAGHLSVSAELTPHPPARAPRLLEASGHAMMAGRAHAARDYLEACLNHARDPALINAARAARANLEMWTGNVRRARELLIGEAERLGDDGGPAATMMLFDGAIASVMGGDVLGGERLAALGESRSHDAGSAVAYVAAMTRCAIALCVGDEDGLARLDALPDPFAALAAPDPLSLARLGVAVTIPFVAGRTHEALALIERYIGLTRSLAAPSMLPYPLASRAELRIVLGDWDGALASAAEAVELADQVGQRPSASFARGILARLASARGEESTARSLAATALAAARAHDAGAVQANIHAALGLLELGVGDTADAAVAELAHADVIARAGGLGAHAVMPYLPDLVEAATRAGRPEVAARAVERLQTMDRSGIPRTLGALERCIGIITDDPAKAIPHLQRAVRLEGQAGVPFEQARSHLVLGERLRQARRRGDARQALTAAHTTFTALGAAPWEERAARSLGALGIRPRPRSPQPAGTLTPKELQVARAAAHGRTNREIAADLFLSVKTVEFHLRNAYGKLGVRSRTELAARLGAAHAPEA